MPATIAIPATITTNPAWFAAQYERAGGAADRLPWPAGTSSEALVNWLNAVAPSLIRCGARVCVVGCGFGEDARELMRRGYEVTAFDCCEQAIARARQMDPAHASNYVLANLFEFPARWKHRFDLVVEANNLCWLCDETRDAAVRSVADLLSMHGRLLVITPASEADDLHDGPPWAITERALLEATALAGLVPDQPLSSFSDESSPTGARLRGTFHRS